MDGVLISTSAHTRVGFSLVRVFFFPLLFSFSLHGGRDRSVEYMYMYM